MPGPVRHSYNLRTRKFNGNSLTDSVNVEVFNQALALSGLGKTIVLAHRNDILNKFVEDKSVNPLMRKRMRAKLWDSPFGFANIDSMVHSLAGMQCDWSTLMYFVDPIHRSLFSKAISMAQVPQ